MPINKRVELGRFDEAVLRKRVYQCEGCGTQQVCFTNHTHRCWPICIGSCRGFVPGDEYNSRREYITQTTHNYVRDYSGPLKPHERVS